MAEEENNQEVNVAEKPPQKSAGIKKKLSGRQKAAMLLVAIGPDQAAEVFKYLKEDEIEQVSMEIAGIKKLRQDNQEGVLEEFYQLCLAREYMAEGGMDYAQDILERAFGITKAEELVRRMNNTLKRMGRPFDFIKNVDPTQLLNFIKDEHPQTIAVILYNIKPSQASTVLMALPEDKQAEVAKRIANMDKPSGVVINKVEELLMKKIGTAVKPEDVETNGIETITDILKVVDRTTERNVMGMLETEDKALAEEIRKKLFTYDDIARLDDRAMQRILREVDNHVLALALKGSTDEMKTLVFKNISSRAEEMIKEEIEVMGPVKLKDVEKAQVEIVTIVLELEKQGEIVIAKGGEEDEMFV